jgi:hypothetical protein
MNVSDASRYMNKFRFLLFLIFLAGCSQKTTISGFPFNPVSVETPESKDIVAVEKQAGLLVESRDFDKLDATAKEFRESGACYPTGMWKLSYFYQGLGFPLDDATDDDWTNRLEILSEWVQSKPNSITARVALANGLIDYAWKARGHDYANKVTNEGWALFSRRLAEAQNVLNEAKGLDEKCPCWWSAMLRVELGLQANRSEYDGIFNDAIQEWPHYTAFYFTRSNYLLPRWYGAEGELERDLEQSANKVGGEAGDVIYAQVVWNMGNIVYSANKFDEYHFSWERTKRGMEDIQKQYPDSLAPINMSAHLAALANDLSAAKTYFNETKGQIDYTCWSSTKEYINCAEFVFSNTR